MKIVFFPDAKSVDAEPGSVLLKVAERAGVLIDASCAGVGKCGKCKVKITKGELEPLAPAEASLLSESEISTGYRLACCVKIKSDMEVVIPSIHGGSTRKKKITRLPDDFVPESRIVPIQKNVPKATMQNQINDVQRIKDAFGKPDMTLAAGLLPKIHQELDLKRGSVTAIFHGDRLIALHAGKTADKCYGIAFDIGTTTVVGMLWNMVTNELVDVEARTNYQSIYGSDVISRIQFTGENPANLSLMQEKVINCFNDILEDLYTRNEINAVNVYDATIVGNTTMSHLVLGVSPRSMSRTPFAPVFCNAQTLQASELGININPQADVYLLPNIAGHVGSDIVGMMLSVGMDGLQGSHVAIDIGTNGEVVAIKDGKMLCCSTAAGPAFEGATIYQGMRAAPGAIEVVSINDGELYVKTIEDLPAVGICGSGLIDAVAALLNAGIVDGMGRMLSRKQAEEAGLPKTLCEHLTIYEDYPAFTLVTRDGMDDIILTQQDIREVQLAKGAILAGMQTLMSTLGIEESTLDSILLAGAFGNYIDKDSAVRIGLFPHIDTERIFSVGNAAGAGSSMALLSDSARKHADEMAVATKHVELSMNKVFQEFYTLSMTFA